MVNWNYFAVPLREKFKLSVHRIYKVLITFLKDDVSLYANILYVKSATCVTHANLCIIRKYFLTTTALNPRATTSGVYTLGTKTANDPNLGWITHKLCHKSTKQFQNLPELSSFKPRLLSLSQLRLMQPILRGDKKIKDPFQRQSFWFERDCPRGFRWCFIFYRYLVQGNACVVLICIFRKW